MSQDQEKKSKKQEEKPAEQAPQEEKKKVEETVKKGKKLKDDLDKLMYEIDDVLEEDAEEFVKSYVQRGGE